MIVVLYKDNLQVNKWIIGMVNAFYILSLK